MAKKIETNLKELKNIVDSLNLGENSLDKSIDLYKKGLDLVKATYKELEEVEQTVTKLVEQEDGLVEEVWNG